ncbi:PXA domain-containing protein [Lentinula aciculospora]|uniref:PXA domain-containing protein n=1 Tax=Lentinula aciculospora TaxID=153920 RepID=A0A9W9ARY9_9AGAR|nr:PXA domain-containing protein [Lentinula aciculospora]
MSNRHVAPSVASNSNSSHTANRTVPLSKRLLFPTAPASSFELPPLLLNPSVTPELNVELYDFIALALRAFVQPWWTKITRYDKEFLPIITNILTHVFRTLEDRLAKSHQRGDLAELVFRDVPVTIIQHYRDFRIAQSKLNSSYATGGALSVPALFHASQSHMAVKPGGEVDLDYVRFLVDHILKTCLPKEDWDPEAERVIVREIIVKIVAQDILGKITQPWFIEKMILDQLMNIPSTKSKVTAPHPSAFSMHALLIFVLTLIQSISGVCLALVHAYRQFLVTIREVNQYSSINEAAHTPLPEQLFIPTSRPPSSPFEPDPLSISRTSSEHSVLSLKPSVSSSSIPDHEHSPSGVSSSSSLEVNSHTHNPHDFATYLLLMIAEVFTTSSRFASNTIVSTVGMATSQGVAGRWLDKFLPYLLMRTLSTTLMLTITRTAKRTLFPHGYPAPPPIDPTPEEQAETRRRLVGFLDGYSMAPLLLGPHPSDTISTALEPLESRECNVHLIISLLDRILGALFPELFDGI